MSSVAFGVGILYISWYFPTRVYAFNIAWNSILETSLNSYEHIQIVENDNTFSKGSIFV